MPTKEGSIKDFSGGIDNVSPDNRVPEGYVRDALNLDPYGTTLSMRTGYSRFLSTTGGRALMALNNHLLFVDGNELKRHDLDTAETEVLGAVTAGGDVAYAEFNGELFISTRDTTLRYDGETLREWGVPDVNKQPEVSVANANSENRLVAMTWMNNYSEEGGTVQPVVVPNGSYSITIPPEPGHVARLYVSPPNAETLYWQGDYEPGTTVNIDVFSENGHPLETHGLRRPPRGHLLTTYGGVLCIASGENVFFTEPFKPHLYDPMKNFVQYRERVGVLLGGLAGLYVSADQCYLLKNVEDTNIEQRGVLEYPAVPGTGVLTQTGRAAWVTRYGMAIEDERGAGAVEEPNRSTFSPPPAESGNTGYIEASGRQLLVSSLERRQGASGQMQAGDFFEAEVSKK